MHAYNKYVTSLKYSNCHRDFESVCCQSKALQELFEALKLQNHWGCSGKSTEPRCAPPFLAVKEC